MRTGLIRIRAAIVASFAILIVLLGLMASNLMVQLRDLSTAATDTALWSVTQLDNQFANLEAAIASELLKPAPDGDLVWLQASIALSRIEIVTQGRPRALFDSIDETVPLMERLERFAQDVIPLVDQPQSLSRADQERLLGLVRDMRPDTRRMSLLTVTEGAARSLRDRANVARQLRWTGGVAIGLMLAMAALFVALDLLLRRAAKRDAQLRASTDSLTSTVAASLDAIVTSDTNGRVTGFNAAAETIFGWRRDEILGQLMEETIVPHAMRHGHREGLHNFVATGEHNVVDKGRIELTALRRNGEEFPIELNITSAEGPDGMSFIAYIRDISARITSEQNLIEARNRAEQADRAKSRFLTVMSHEMRTPLNGILGVLDLLKTTHLTPKQERYAQVAIGSGEILLEHVNEALDITRIETGTLALNMAGFDLPALVGSVTQVLEPLAREKGLTLGVRIDDAAKGRFVGDANRIRQILTNLLGNAIKFTESGGITVTASVDADHATPMLAFAVADTGPGISDTQRDHVFDDFVAFAAPEDDRQRRGDGLGLSISRRIARQMGGEVMLDTTLGTGSKFTLLVPMQVDDTPDASQEALIDDIARTTPSRHILVVEDNAVNRHVLRDMLEGMGHRVEEAVNGVEALARADETAFDLIFMDISMPIMDGIEATRALRSGNGRNKATRIIGLTAHGREEYRDAAKEAGMDRFHTKPIRLAALHDILADPSDHDAAPRPSAQEPDALQELIHSLGAQAVTQAVTRFFDECDAFLVQLPNGAASLPATAHQMKGAAAMFGFAELEARFDALSDALRDDPKASPKDQGDGIKTAMEQAQNIANAALARNETA